MKLLNHPHIIKLYQVRAQVRLFLWVPARVLFSARSLQFPDFAPLWVFVAVRERRGVCTETGSCEVFRCIFNDFLAFGS